MKADVTFSQVYWNKGLMNFFFREQAAKTLEDFLKRSSASISDTLDALNDATEDMNLDDVEETFYSESVEDCAETFGIDLKEEEDDEDEE